MNTWQEFLRSPLVLDLLGVGSPARYGVAMVAEIVESEDGARCALVSQQIPVEIVNQRIATWKSEHPL